MTDSTAARRALLRILLDRVERGALLPDEAPLLRACVGAEQGAADTATFVTIQARADQAAIARVHDAMDARPPLATDQYERGWSDAFEVIRAAFGGSSPTLHDGRRGSRRERITAALLSEHYRRARERIVASPEEHCAAMADAVLDAIDGQTTPDGTPPTPVDEPDGPPCWHIEPGTTCDWNICRQPERLAAGDPGTDPTHGLATPNLDALRAGRPITVDQAIDVLADEIARQAVEGNGTGQMLGVVASTATSDGGQQTGDDEVEIVHANDIPTDWAKGTELRCLARYTGPPPMIDVKWGASADYRCELRVHTRGTDHAILLGCGPFSWTDDIAVWPLATGAPSADDVLPGVRISRRGDAGWVWECHRCAAWSGEHYTSEDIAREYALTKHVAHVGEVADKADEFDEAGPKHPVGFTAGSE